MKLLTDILYILRWALLLPAHLAAQSSFYFAPGALFVLYWVRQYIADWAYVVTDYNGHGWTYYFAQSCELYGVLLMGYAILICAKHYRMTARIRVK